jgi:hypothetical protein
MVDGGSRKVVEVQVRMKGVTPGTYALMVESTLGGTVSRRKVEVEVEAANVTPAVPGAPAGSGSDPTQGSPEQTASKEDPGERSAP